MKRAIMKLEEAKTILKENGYLLKEMDEDLIEELSWRYFKYEYGDWGKEFADICRYEYDLDINDVVNVWKAHPGIIDSNVDPDRVAAALNDYLNYRK
jgi:hypothetical protein